MLESNSRGVMSRKSGKLIPRDSFDIRQGYTNSRPGSLGVLEMTQMDGPGFSLCAAPLESLVLDFEVYGRG